MLSLKILIAYPEQIDLLKADLTKSLPHVKSSHRVEALARSLGFKTYASLRARDLSWDGPFEAEINWIAFNDYLKEKGFTSTARPLYLAAGRASIQLIMGMQDYRDLSWQIHKERAEENILSDSAIEEFLSSYNMVSQFSHTRTITKKRNADNLKQLAEKLSFTYPDGEVCSPRHVATGSVVLAALAAGFWFRPNPGQLPELHFNMRQSSIDEFENQMMGNTKEI